MEQAYRHQLSSFLGRKTMRADMFKIIVERPRWGAGHAPSVKLKRDKNVDRKFVGHKRHALEEAAYVKSLSENLAPLRRYLQKQRGRRWDDVFSEICQRLDTASTVKMHVRDHIADLIIVQISVDHDGKWLGQHRWHGASEPNRWWPDLYVDPFDGIIKETRSLCAQINGVSESCRRDPLCVSEAGPFDDFQRLTTDSFLLRRKGLWFLGTLVGDPRCTDGLLRSEIQSEQYHEHQRWSVSGWKQLSKKELKRYKISNRGGIQ